MIGLDTNVVSETMKPAPHPAVLSWLNSQVAETLYLSSVTLAELLFGIGALPSGKRKTALGKTLEGLVELFGNRVLSFDVHTAHRYGELAPLARARGQSFPIADAYIAAIAAAQGFIVASRDTVPYESAGVRCINPWTAKP